MDERKRERERERERVSERVRERESLTSSAMLQPNLPGALFLVAPLS